MRAEVASGDYHFYLTPAEIGEMTTRVQHPIFPARYPSLITQIRPDEGPGAFAIVAASCDSSVYFAAQGIHYSRSEDDDPIFEVFPSRMYPLRDGEVPYLMTRYDGTNKVWFYLESEEDRADILTFQRRSAIDPRQAFFDVEEDRFKIFPARAA